MKLMKGNAIYPGIVRGTRLAVLASTLLEGLVPHTPLQSVSLVVAAMPLDVRRGSAFPSQSVKNSGGYASERSRDMASLRMLPRG
jgi:hypothetical protein